MAVDMKSAIVALDFEDAAPYVLATMDRAHDLREVIAQALRIAHAKGANELADLRAKLARAEAELAEANAKNERAEAALRVDPAAIAAAGVVAGAGLAAERAEADRCPPLHSAPIPESSDAIVTCSNCGEERDEPHSWRECAEWLRKSRDVDVCLYAAHKAIADIQRMLGANEEDANANYSDALDLAREVSGKVDDLERAVRVLTELRDTATAREAADAAAMREAASSVLAAIEPVQQAPGQRLLPRVNANSAPVAALRAALSGTAGAALLREVEAGRALAAALRSQAGQALYVRAALTAYDAARGAR